MSEYLDLGMFDPEDTFRLLDYSGSKWRRMGPKDQQRVIDEIFDYYRNRHGFPYREMDLAEQKKHLWRLKRRKAVINDGLEIQWDNTGSPLCTHGFPHLWEVRCGTQKTAWEAFNNDAYLKEAIRFCLTLKERVTPHEIISAFSLGTNAGIRVVARFKPMAAKAIWQRYTPPGGTVYDYACGWGGRLLGALSADLRYVGVDPEPRTHECLIRLARVATDTYGTEMPRIEKTGSEMFCPAELHGTVDMAFSSPPYFDLEQYADDDSQSHVKFDTVDAWLEGYLGATFRNVHKLLKPGGVLAMNLTDYGNIRVVDKALAVIEDAGFKPLETLKMMVIQRRGRGQSRDPYKHEPIYAFTKR